MSRFPSRMMAMTAMAIGLALIVSTSAAVADEFRFLTTDSPARLERALRDSAAEGYRIIAAAQGLALDGGSQVSVLLQASPGGYEYAVLTITGKLDDESQRTQLDELAGRGFRLSPGYLMATPVEEIWLPESAYEEQILMILERSPAAAGNPRAFAYETVSFTGFRRFGIELQQRTREGFSTIALLNTGRKLSAVMERTDDGPDPDRENNDAFQLVLKAKRRGLKHRLSRESVRGYRVLAAADQTIRAPPVVLLTRDGISTEPLQYKFVKNPLKKIRKGKLASKLNKRARKGFRVERHAVSNGLIPMKRLRRTKPSREQREIYETVSSKDDATVSRHLEAATAEGYRVLTMFVAAGETTVILELASPASARGQPVQNAQAQVDHGLGLNRIDSTGP